MLNGSVNALTTLHPLHAKVGESVRIYFGVGGPNFTSSFHVIGEIFDAVCGSGRLQREPARGTQTVAVPPGGATVVEFTPVVPGNYAIVDHALARMERGLAGGRRAAQSRDLRRQAHAGNGALSIGGRGNA